MDKLAFTALASINNQANMRTQITNSLANVSTVGFKVMQILLIQILKNVKKVTEDMILKKN